tara:strand:- start:1168 stop:1836 length:669 start_codon:yes stop_codon:yes gene_type:complete
MSVAGAEMKAAVVDIEGIFDAAYEEDNKLKKALRKAFIRGYKKGYRLLHKKLARAYELTWNKKKGPLSNKYEDDSNTPVMQRLRIGYLAESNIILREVKRVIANEKDESADHVKDAELMGEAMGQYFAVINSFVDAKEKSIEYAGVKTQHKVKPLGFDEIIQGITRLNRNLSALISQVSAIEHVEAQKRKHLIKLFRRIAKQRLWSEREEKLLIQAGEAWNR